jgi:hypothetical protein
VDKLKEELEQKISGIGPPPGGDREDARQAGQPVGEHQRPERRGGQETTGGSLKDEARTAAMSTIKDITEEAKLTANKEAKRIVIQTIQRVATEHAVENSA